MGGVPGFNPGGLPWRAYLSGQDERYCTRFWMQTPMFLRKGGVPDVPTPEYLHPWVIQAERQSKVFRANPDRPRVWVKEGEDGFVTAAERLGVPVEKSKI